MVGEMVDVGGGNWDVAVGVGVFSKTGVGGTVVTPGVGVGTTTLVMFNTAPSHSMLVRVLSPLEVRALHSSAVCPATKPLTSKVNTGPLVVARLPLLPAIATMKLPFCGPLMATAASVPKRLVVTMLLTSARLGS